MHPHPGYPTQTWLVVTTKSAATSCHEFMYVLKFHTRSHTSHMTRLRQLVQFTCRKIEGQRRLLTIRTRAILYRYEPILPFLRSWAYHHCVYGLKEGLGQWWTKSMPAVQHSMASCNTIPARPSERRAQLRFMWAYKDLVAGANLPCIDSISPDMTSRHYRF